METKVKCIKTHIFKTKIVSLVDGQTKIKQFEIAEGTTGTCCFGKRSINTRIKLDIPLLAIDEKEDKICSIFIPTKSISKNWLLND